MDREQLIEKAREFVGEELQIAGDGQKARRLVMEFEGNQTGGMGWGFLVIADKMADFAATIVRERDTELARKLRDVNLSYDITQRHRLGDIISELLESGKEQGC